MTGAPRHVVFGTGAVGLAVLDPLHRRGERARPVNRSGSAPVPDGVEILAGDARDTAFTTAVAAGATVVHQALNPPFPRWADQFPRLQAGVLAAAEATGARLVAADDVYAHGRPPGRPLTEDRAEEAHTRKGRLRARMSRDLLTAHRAGRVEVAVGRASDHSPSPARGATGRSRTTAVPA